MIEMTHCKFCKATIALAAVAFFSFLWLLSDRLLVLRRISAARDSEPTSRYEQLHRLSIKQLDDPSRSHDRALNVMIDLYGLHAAELQYEPEGVELALHSVNVYDAMRLFGGQRSRFTMELAGVVPDPFAIQDLKIGHRRMRLQRLSLKGEPVWLNNLLQDSGYSNAPEPSPEDPLPVNVLRIARVNATSISASQASWIWTDPPPLFATHKFLDGHWHSSAIIWFASDVELANVRFYAKSVGGITAVVLEPGPIR